jgi:hypothetical protein
MFSRHKPEQSISRSRIKRPGRGLLVLLFLGCLLSHNPLQAQPDDIAIDNRVADLEAWETYATLAGQVSPQSAPLGNPSELVYNDSLSQKVGQLWQAMDTNLEALDTSFTRITFFIGKIAIFLLSGVLVYRISVLILKRPSELVIGPFVNASGKEDLDKATLGLQQLCREYLISEIRNVRQKVRTYAKSLGPENYHLSDQHPFPSSRLDETITKLLNSVKEITSEKISPVLPLVNLIFPPRGTSVTCFLQAKLINNQEILGITAEIGDLQGRFPPNLFTFWDADQGPHEDRPSEDTSQNNWPDTHQWIVLKSKYHERLKPLTRWIALEISRTEMLAKAPVHQQKRKAYMAQVHHFLGALNLASAHRCGDTFLDFAITDLKYAKASLPDWYRPYDTLAEVYISRAKASTGKIKLFFFNAALSEFSEIIQNFSKDEEVIKQAKLGKARVLAELETPEALEQSQQIVNEIKDQWQINTEKDDRFLYNMCLWHILYGIKKTHCREEYFRLAFQYLCAALLRSTRYKGHSLTDSELTPIQPEAEKLADQLDKYVRLHPEVCASKGQDFGDAVHYFETLIWQARGKQN